MTLLMAIFHKAEDLLRLRRNARNTLVVLERQRRSKGSKKEKI